MDDIDKRILRDVNDEELFMTQVICGDAELLYIDAVLGAVLRSEA